jgi:glycosyltransferase involved in cell wall biosynthesis
LARIVAISDFCAPLPVEPASLSYAAYRAAWERVACREPSPPCQRPEVRGGYLERLPLAAVRAGLCSSAEVWSFAGTDIDERTEGGPDRPQPLRRRFRADGPAPYASADVLAHLDVFGPPAILCIWGLGVDAAILERCRASVRVYNSIDAPALRIPEEVSRHIDLFLASAPWQEEAIRARHADALVAVMPIGPEFASPETFFPIDAPKDFDVIYVAAAQAYKRHDIMLDAFAQLPRRVRGLCLFGYGEDAGAIRGEIARRQLEIVCVGPPGLPYSEVNALMNSARIGLVCGEEDGAPAILTEYMLAGLPVLANARLRCGLDFIRPETGIAAPAGAFGEAILALLARAPALSPRDVVLENWAWERTIERFSAYVACARRRKGGG